MYIFMNDLSPKMQEFALAVFEVLDFDPEFDIDIVYEDIDAHGYCSGDEDGCLIEINPDLTERETAIAIAHELVHARQLAQGVDFCEEEAYTLESVLTERCYH
jgi:Zn-dependent peptidase ImmA (M78 family)